MEVDPFFLELNGNQISNNLYAGNTGDWYNWLSESVSDIANVISRFNDIIMARLFNHQDMGNTNISVADHQVGWAVININAHRNAWKDSG